ncbi:hypothetical protein [Bacillus cereus group sp. BceL294]|uniref:hypothetical protein n=1 Tax=Bacillus cereus group sp. BceL294 TaxID=3444991 RepID=UPI003F1EC5AB
MNTSITENVDIIVFLSMFNNIGVFGQMCLNVQEISLIVSKMCPNVHIFTFGAVTPITDSNKTRKTERLFLGGTKKMIVIDLTKIIEFV